MNTIQIQMQVQIQRISANTKYNNKQSKTMANNFVGSGMRRTLGRAQVHCRDKIKSQIQYHTNTNASTNTKNKRKYKIQKQKKQDNGQ